MTGPYAPHSIVMEIEIGTSDRFLLFDPDSPSGDRWLHQLAEFDRTLDHEAVRDRYALPESDEYEVFFSPFRQACR